MNAFSSIAQAESQAITRWTHDPRAIALLASIRNNPPKCEARCQVYAITRDDWHEYVGERVDQLEAVRQEYGDRLLAEGDNEAFTREWSELGSVHQVIDQVLA